MAALSDKLEFHRHDHAGMSIRAEKVMAYQTQAAADDADHMNDQNLGHPSTALRPLTRRPHRGGPPAGNDGGDHNQQWRARLEHARNRPAVEFKSPESG